MTDRISAQSDGHAALVRSADLASRQCLQNHPLFVECWSGLLGLYYQGLIGEHESPFQEEDVKHVAWHLRQTLLAGAVDTSKLAFEATLVGYYAQALMLSRHMLETWLQVRYAFLRPDQARRWFNTIEQGSPQEPNFESIIKEVLKDGEDIEGTISVNKAVSELRRAAHPSSWLVDQVRGDGSEPIALGGRYRRNWCFQAFDRGTLATFALMSELKRQIPQPHEWMTEFDRLLELRNSNYPRSMEQAGQLPAQPFDASAAKSTSSSKE